ncbi:MAG: hypothetical protein U9O85_07155 [Euryarchaeota archaeon]|nr:hypothetical protein [Euryarchaeota archaeon]
MIFAIAFAIPSVSAYDGISGLGTEEQESSIMIAGYQVSPEVLMRNDVGTVTVTVKNMESDKSVNIKDARMLSRDIKVLSDSYFNIGRLGPGESLNLTFTIKAICPDGIYYPRILVDGEDAQNIRYSMPVTVDSSSLTIGVKDIPEDIFKEERARIELAVGNPKQNTVTAVKIVTEEKEVIPSEVFVGALSTDESKVASFNFTPQTKGAHILNFKLEFKNGDNYHYTDLSVPLNVTESKKSAELILTGIEVEPLLGMSLYKITGDINNAGLKEAKSVVMKVDDAEGIEAMHPYKAYFVGLLSADDFSSFELDVKVGENVTQVPLVIEYKDEDGNMFSKTEYISFERHQGTTSSGELPISMIVVLVVIAIAVLGLIAYSWKRR